MLSVRPRESVHTGSTPLQLVLHPTCPHGGGPYSPLSSLGTFVTRAEATDADDPETDNAALRFSILEQGTPEFFSIDEHTGEIRTVQVGLDREVRQPRGHS